MSNRGHNNEIVRCIAMSFVRPDLGYDQLQAEHQSRAQMSANVVSSSVSESELAFGAARSRSPLVQYSSLGSPRESVTLSRVAYVPAAFYLCEVVAVDRVTVGAPVVNTRSATRSRGGLRRQNWVGKFWAYLDNTSLLLAPPVRHSMRGLPASVKSS